MTLFETFALTIGASLAKHMLSEWLGSGWVSQVSQDLVKLLSDTAIGRATSRSDKTQIDTVADGIVKEMDEWVKIELGALEKPERRLIFEEVAHTLASARIDAKMLVANNLDPDPLASYLAELRPEATRTFSGQASALYNRLIKEAATGIVKRANKIPGIEVAIPRKLLESNERIVDSMEAQRKREDSEVLDFERRYREAIVRKFARMELFGLSGVDEVASHQSLSIAFVGITLADPNYRVAYFAGHGIPPSDVEDLFKPEDDVIGATPRFSNVVSDHSQYDARFALLNACQSAEDTETGTIIADSLVDGWRYRLTRALSGMGKHNEYPPGFVIRGSAGSGKTTLLQWLAIRLCKLGQSVEPIRMPFLLRLREFVDTGFPAPEDFVRLNTPMLAGNMPRGWVHKVLQDGRAAVLIDGIDEVPQSKRVGILSALQDLMETYPNNCLAITSRPTVISREAWPEWTKWVKSRGLEELEILDLGQGQVEELIDNWHRALSDSLTDESEKLATIASAQGLKRQLAKRPELRRLTVNPLLCAMVCAANHQNSGNLPSGRSNLYRDCVEILLYRRDLRRNVKSQSDYPVLQHSQIERLIQSVAYWMIRNGLSEASVEDVDLHFDPILKRMNVCETCASAVRRYFVERTNLLREPALGRIDFPHRSLQEYLAGLAAVEENDFNVLLDHAVDDQWRETIIMAVGAARRTERTRFLEKLIGRADSRGDEHSRNQLYLLAIACFEPLVEFDHEVRQLVLSRAATLVPPLTREEAQSISMAGNPVVQLLGPDPDYSSQEASLCIDTLALIGTEDAMEAIRAFTKDRRLMTKVSIGNAWNSFDRTTYANKVLRECDELMLADVPMPQEFEVLTHLKELDFLRPSNAKLSLLAGMTQLELLSLAGSESLEDIHVLGQLPALKRLSLSRTRVTDFRFLARLVNLEALNMTATRATDISPIRNLDKLSWLAIVHARFPDLELLGEMTSLKSLLLDGDQFLKATDFGALGRIENLSIVHLAEADPLEVAFRLGALSNLRSLRIDCNVLLANSTRLIELPNLLELDLSNCPQDFSCIPVLPNLTSLRVSAENAGSVDQLRLFSSLRTLTLDVWRFDSIDLAWLRELEHLETLVLVNVRSLIGALPMSEKLENIYLNSNQARNLEDVLKLPSLKRIVVEGPGRIDRQSLRDHPSVVVERQ